MSLPNLKTIYESQGLTREEVARHLGLSESLLYKWEKGIRNVNGDQLKKLSSFLGCTTDEILGLAEVAANG